MVTIDGIEFKKSKTKNKKYDAFKGGKKLASFGAIKASGVPYSQYYDKIGLYKKYNHNDKNRRRRYHARHGRPDKKYSPKWFSGKYLW